MIKKQHKAISLILCLMLALSAVITGTVSAVAATGETVYVKVNNGWSNVNCYMWGSGIGNNADWPGVKMTKVEDDVYSYTLTNEFDKVIFNNGGDKTGDLSYKGHGKIYDLKNGTWSDYAGAEPTTQGSTTATSATETKPVTTTPSTGGTTVYCNNKAKWSSVKCYMWNSSSDSNSSWPGVSMTDLGDGVYEYVASKSFKNCIFNDGGSNQTSDLTAKDGQIFDNSTNQWSVYDTSDLQIRAFAIDPNADVYVGTDVMVSANAINKNGAEVSYQFSVKSSNGNTTVISDYSSVKSLVWTPSAVGTYTLALNVKDTAGNENSREITVAVEDDTQLAKPVIKGVIPSSINLIQTNTPTTVSVKAGGGKTGTNLLFYKYIVTEPNGTQNTPYYTLSSTYTFTPAQVGAYSVEVYVQGSDNSTVNKSYQYTATNVPVSTGTTVAPTQPTTEATQPTTQVPTQATTVATEPATTHPAFIKGDADGDGRLTIKDATYIQKHIADYASCASIDITVADMDDNGKINIKDATLIQKALANY